MPSLLAEYLAYLTDNRRLSPHSVRAYHATADRLTGFLQLHWGTDIERKALRKVADTAASFVRICCEACAAKADAASV